MEVGGGRPLDTEHRQLQGRSPWHGWRSRTRWGRDVSLQLGSSRKAPFWEQPCTLSPRTAPGRPGSLVSDPSHSRCREDGGIRCLHSRVRVTQSQELRSQKPAVLGAPVTKRACPSARSSLGQVYCFPAPGSAGRWPRSFSLRSPRMSPRGAESSQLDGTSHCAEGFGVRGWEPSPLCSAPGAHRRADLFLTVQLVSGFCCI